jgi:AcrR family transcriptional regulator
VRIQTNPERSDVSDESATEVRPARRRLSVSERERQIIDGAIEFFSSNGFGGQLRDLAKSIGVTHALLYHYFPTKQALIDRVYLEVFQGRWRDSWDALLDDPSVDVEDKFTLFYADYVNNGLSREFVRILMFSGLMDHTITDRFFAMLRERLFPRLIRETRRYRGSTSRAKPSERELELLMGLHGGMYYISIRRWIYGQDVHSEAVHETCDDALVRDRVRGYLHSSRELLHDTPGPTAKTTAKKKTPAR